MLRLEFGDSLSKLNNKQNDFRITRILDTINYLCNEKQSFLTQSVEDLLGHSMSPEVKVNINYILQKSLQNHLPYASHALLFVGTKLLVHHKRDKKMHLCSRDVFLLIILAASHLNPRKSIDEDFYESILELLNHTDTSQYEITLRELFEKYSISDIRDFLNHSFFSTYSSHLFISCIKLILKKFNLFNGKVDTDFCDQLAHTILDYQESEELSVTGNIDKNTISSIVKKYVINMDIDEATDEEIEASLVLLLVSGEYEDSLNGMMSRLDECEIRQYPNSVYQNIYLSSCRDKPSRAYCATICKERDQSVTLVVIISKDKFDENHEKVQLGIIEEEVRQAIMANYVQYLFSLEKSYTMITYIHQFPGLIHFMFADRSLNKFLAPEITSLIGQDSEYISKSKKILRIIKQNVWNMYYHSQYFLSKGYYDMIMKHGDFLYSYKLFFEDSSGHRLIPRKAISLSKNGYFTRATYKKLKQEIFPDLNGVKCFELFCLYIGTVPIKTVELLNEALISMLPKKTNRS